MSQDASADAKRTSDTRYDAPALLSESIHASALNMMQEHGSRARQGKCPHLTKYFN
jgi:hypothetical protein